MIESIGGGTRKGASSTNWRGEDMGIHCDRELLIDELPVACVKECTVGGRDADPYVKYWRKHLDFTVNRENACFFATTN